MSKAKSVWLKIDWSDPKASLMAMEEAARRVLAALAKLSPDADHINLMVVAPTGAGKTTINNTFASTSEGYLCMPFPNPGINTATMTKDILCYAILEGLVRLW